MAGFPAREVCAKFALAVVKRGVGHFSTVNAKVVTEGGYPSPLLFPPLDLFTALFFLSQNLYG